MMGMSDHHHQTSQSRHQAAIDADDALELEKSERAEAATNAFNDACKSRNMKTPMPFTSIGVFANYQKIGERQETIEEVLWSALESEEIGQQVFSALILCAAQGNQEARDALDSLRDKYVELCVQQLED